MSLWIKNKDKEVTAQRALDLYISGHDDCPDWIKEVGDQSYMLIEEVLKEQKKKDITKRDIVNYMDALVCAGSLDSVKDIRKFRNHKQMNFIKRRKREKRFKIMKTKLNDKKYENLSDKIRVLSNDQEELLEGFSAISNAVWYYHTIDEPKNHITRLNNVVDEENFNAIKSKLDVDSSSFDKLDVISYNKVFEAKHKESGRDIIIKANGDGDKANKEAAANYWLSQHKKLANLVARGYFPVAFENGQLYLTVQDKIVESGNYNRNHYMAAIAMLHSHAEEALKPSEIVIPDFKAPEFDKILDDVAKGDNPNLYKHLRSEFNDAVAELNESGLYVICHKDLKPDNLKAGKFLDFEHLCRTDPALDDAGYLALNHIPQGQWLSQIQGYMNQIQQEGVLEMDISPEEMLKKVKRIAIVPMIKEYGGLCSRKTGKKEKEQKERLSYSLVA